MTARIDQASAPKKGRASRLLPLLPFLFALPLMLLLGARIAEALRQALKLCYFSEIHQGKHPGKDV